MDGDLIMKILLIDLNDRFALTTLLLSTFASDQLKSGTVGPDR